MDRTESQTRPGAPSGLPGDAGRDPANPASRRDNWSASALTVAVAAFGRLPLRCARALGAVLGLLVFLGSPRYRRKLVTNLMQAGLDGGGRRWRAAMQAGQALAEMPFVWTRSGDEIAARVRTEGYERIAVLQEQGVGILFLTPHLGAFDLAARHFGNTAPITVMFRPPRLRALEPVLYQSRNNAQRSAVPANLAGVRAMIRALRAGQAVGLLPDQVPLAGHGRWAPFFGRPAFTMTLPARLAGAARLKVLLAVAERVKGGWKLRIEPLEADPQPEVLNAAMEALIRSCPDQYLWGYSRYRSPPGAEPPGIPSSGCEASGSCQSPAPAADRSIGGAS